MMMLCTRVYKKVFSIVLVGLLISSLFACSSVPSQNTQQLAEDAALSRASVVSTGALNLDRNNPSTISWLSAIDIVGNQNIADINATKINTLKVITQSAIERQISRKGYPLVSIAGDYQMKALLVLSASEHQDESVSDASDIVEKRRSELLHNTGIDPGLAGGQYARGKGSLIIELRQGHVVRWRGAVQIYLLPDSDAAIAAQRIEHAVSSLLVTWP